MNIPSILQGGLAGMVVFSVLSTGTLAWEVSIKRAESRAYQKCSDDVLDKANAARGEAFERLDEIFRQEQKK